MKSLSNSQGFLQDKARGMLIGLAIGDSLGAPYEFGYTSKEITELKDEVATMHEAVACPKGSWTDDTSMALCLSQSLLDCEGYDSYDVMEKYCRWVDKGYMTYDGKPADDAGRQVSGAIKRFKVDPVIRKDEPRSEAAGNGAIMRLAPVVIAMAHPGRNCGTVAECENLAVVQARETHYSEQAERAAKWFAIILCQAMSDINRHSLDVCIDRFCNEWYNNSDLAWRDYGTRIRTDKKGDSFKDLGGYVHDSLAIAIWGIRWSDSFVDGMIRVICLGGDTDTNAAIYGQLAGAYYGYDAIPDGWKKGLIKHDEILAMADKLLNMDKCPIIRTRFEEDGNLFGLPGDKQKM